MTTREVESVELEAFLAEWYAPAYRTACLLLDNAAEAGDAVQDAFLRLWRFRDAIPTGEAQRPWCYRVVVNACYSRARSEHRRRVREDREAGRASSEPTPGPDEQFEASERADVVRTALAELPETLRVPLVLRYYAGLSEREIATAIRRRPGTVKSRLFEARRRLSASPALAALVEQAPPSGERSGEVAP